MAPPESLAGDEEHDPAEHDGRSDEEREAVKAVAQHAPRGFALGNAEDGGGKSGEQQDRREVSGAEH